MLTQRPTRRVADAAAHRVDVAVRGAVAQVVAALQVVALQVVALQVVVQRAVVLAPVAREAPRLPRHLRAAAAESRSVRPTPVAAAVAQVGDAGVAAAPGFRRACIAHQSAR